jgi:hypothetical protein
MKTEMQTEIKTRKVTLCQTATFSHTAERFLHLEVPEDVTDEEVAAYAAYFFKETDNWSWDSAEDEEAELDEATVEAPIEGADPWVVTRDMEIS